MSYQVLARKWRPKNFEQLKGQEHVSRALVNAIETERLHHAYLFTGTRGVGKTTIARILSKCLNCETNGLTAKPCGQCASCVEIDEGRFVDLIEVDAASRTKVDDTRELLENVQYRPTRGRYKVYLIDEVHMLSNSSFNALLKTLEEPPEHVVFLLATTDPQKLPVTVLSRCLQFHLKHMDEQTIAQHLSFILEQENIVNQSSALELIALSAEGSMRDALSLLDQAIAFGNGQVNEDDIRFMLGTIDHQFMVKLLQALANHDSKAAIETIDQMSHFPVDFADALKELLSRLHQIAIYQATQVLLDNSANYIKDFADQISTEDIQLYYQMGLHARRDLAWAATPKQGLEMALLRMLSFKVATNSQASSDAQKKELKKKLKLTDDALTASSEAVAKQQLNESLSVEQKKTELSQNLVKEQAQPDPLKVSPEPAKPDQALVESANTASNHSVNPIKLDEKESISETKVNELEPPFNADDYQHFFSSDEEDVEQFVSQDATDQLSKKQSREQRQISSYEFTKKIHDKNPSDIAESEPKQKSSISQSSTEHIDPLASLHAALGIGAESSSKNDGNGLGDKPAERVSNLDKAIVEAKQIDNKSSVESSSIINPDEDSSSAAFFNKTIEDELEETTRQPLDIPDYQTAESPFLEEKDDSLEQLKQTRVQVIETQQEKSDLVAGSDNSRINVEPKFDVQIDNRQEFEQENLQWAELVIELGLAGTYRQIAASSVIQWLDKDLLKVEVSKKQEIICTESAKAGIKQALMEHLGHNIKIDWSYFESDSKQTPAVIWNQQAIERHERACQILLKHPFVQQLQAKFDVQLDRQSVEFLD